MDMSIVLTSKSTKNSHFALFFFTFTSKERKGMVVTRKLSRSSAHRKALMRNLVTSLIKEGQIKTTIQKAKEARRHADNMVQIAKRGGDANYRRVMGFVTDKKAVKTLFDDLAVRFKDRNGGYTRVVPFGRRRGDNAPMALLEYLPVNYVSFSSKGKRPIPVPPFFKNQGSATSEAPITPNEPETLNTTTTTETQS